MNSIETVRVATRQVLAEHSPDELLLIEAYDPTDRSVASSGPMGFGAEAATLVLLGIVWKLVEETLIEVAKAGASEWAKSLCKTWRSTSDGRPIDQEDHKRAIGELAGRLTMEGVPPSKAAEIAVTALEAILNSAK